LRRLVANAHYDAVQPAAEARSQFAPWTADASFWPSMSTDGARPWTGHYSLSEP
jgi:hypothetical protein